jgi:hypothetical protein
MDETFELGEYSAALILKPNCSYPYFALDVKLYVPTDQQEKVPDHMLAISELAHIINQEPNLVSELAQRAKNRIKGYRLESTKNTFHLIDETNNI